MDVTDQAGDGPPRDDIGLEEQLAQLRGDVRLLGEVVDDFLHGTSGSAQAGEESASFEPFYPGLEEWVVDYFAPMYARAFTPTERWCAQWWDHAEAISRLEALWRSWEVARLDELRGMALWYRDFLDGQLPVLLSSTGPFAACTPDRHAPPKPLTTLPAPAGYWTDDKTNNETDDEPLPGRREPGSTSR